MLSNLIGAKQMRTYLILSVAIIAMGMIATPSSADDPYPVWAWGLNNFDQLGRETQTASRAYPDYVPDLGSAVAVAASYSYSVALKSDGTVWSWGCGDCGQFGNNDDADSVTPVQAVCLDEQEEAYNLTNIESISVGRSHTLALSNGGEIWSWGVNSNGQLGDGTTGLGNHRKYADKVEIPPIPPQEVAYLGSIEQVAAGDYFSVALDSSGQVWTWGHSGNGRLCDNDTRDAEESDRAMRAVGPDGVGYLNDVEAIAAGGGHVLALRTNGTLWAWGYNNVGQIGNGEEDDNPDVPVRVKGPGGVGYLENVIAIAAGSQHSLAIVEDPVTQETAVYAWGSGYKGQLGIDDESYTLTPVRVKSPDGQGYLQGIVAIASSADCNSSFALDEDGNLYGWGDSNNGQLGPGTSSDDVMLPLPITRVGGVTAFAAGGEHTLAIAPLGIRTAELDWSWVYQNTPVTTQDLMHSELTITVYDADEPQDYDVAVTVLDSEGDETEGDLFPEESAADELIWTITGGRMNADLPTYPASTPGDYTLVVEVEGQTSGVACGAMVDIKLRKLCDVDGNGWVDTTDKLEMNRKLNGIPTSYPDRAFDLYVDGAIDTNDKLQINRVLNGITVP
jgi:alpha-tubulin suppressor-like RCC1 family protein